MISFPNAKINIGLNILRRRNDGYHDIETIFYPVKLCDILEIIENPPDSHLPAFHNTGLQMDVPLDKNLCIKAYHLLKNEHKLPEISIHLHKIIPFGAGLGGGSSDAVFTVTLLNKFFSLGLTNDKIKNYALMLGSDCVFFTENKPLIARGRGELIEHVDLSLTGYNIVIVKPQFGISTIEAYSEVIPHKPACNLEDSIQTSIEKWPELIGNDFEKHLFDKYPELPKIKEKLYKIGALYASMSGSGSAIYGIFKDEQDITDLFPGCFVWKGIME
jgi:4-diphosphocytidyl-2-C-methyl-D-erythritol kinase